jgi:hypothetical protein
LFVELGFVFGFDNGDSPLNLILKNFFEKFKEKRAEV